MNKIGIGILATAGRSLLAIAAGGGSTIPVSIIWSDYEPEDWALDITDKNDSVQSLSDESPTGNIEFTQDGSTWHAYDFSFTQTGFDIRNGITVNGSNAINAENQFDTGESGDPASTAGTGIQIDAGSNELVITIEISQPI